MITLLRPAVRLPLTIPRTAGIRYNSSLAAGTTRDPSHPHLYYHASPPPPAAPQSLILTFTPGRPTEFLSFLPLGSTPVLPSGRPDLTAFQEHPYFRSVFNAAIRDALDKGGNKGLEYEAARRGSDGYITIKDERAVPDHDRTGPPEDIIGSVFVKDGKIVPSTYEPLPTYRLVTPTGVCRLPHGLDSHLMNMLNAIAEQEAENARLNAEEAAEEEAALEKERQRIAEEEAAKRG
ncbi:hypothetical protein CC85DRAFT_284636 [Cutaneotrichosporon oleaginosum]|uniref:Uncharacterized protein n=1 Tax=Cutaneotrichosporon oleaginosum TaxID=879819 RepID=A0A0J0XQ93_9TREE|nr:uncharacterized protein CC85DRAFT_284636 [Cutaneotrichosporon oleaginosum]KLT43291.1 hypothetical protein CC85DRAFT_284636 [Cutaneotrichosporon oleaginosum]TXT14446.1 hypothetical protein COLE_00639 [Cutaneotrichosporon oleaginosum]